ncbi:MAG: hypothetical protein K2K52_09865, partial [Paramuribaculum sp.]|nr:hypothetical protein [Paramuribaculum sp.]
MKYLSTGNHSLRIPFKEAVITGIAEDGGLYLPAEIPLLPEALFRNMYEMSLKDISYVVLSAFVGEELSSEKLKEAISSIVTFPIPVMPLQGGRIFAAELYQGPSGSYRDLSVRFMAYFFELFFDCPNNEKIKLVASVSSDYAIAVSDAFSFSDKFRIYIVYPKGKLSQEAQKKISKSGNNITAVEVRGSESECLAVTQASLTDKSLRDKIVLTSANSINISSVLPLVIQYFHICGRMMEQGADAGKIVIAVSGGNLADAAALLIAAEMGLPIKRIIATYFEKEYQNPINKPRVDYLSKLSKIPVSTVLIKEDEMKLSSEVLFNHY